ncbi:hypothetical protein TELCIR_08878 [Teladorsagia circumcincta]|uniref:Uncharacterized protein n=1 Tax=Teladorsagia circumcincta TaxID=45464 RepID=A0A2G9UII0_TELCI|nr:hypothetical protein TELCIR_08878 [Teladorsagia circumcincta]
MSSKLGSLILAFREAEKVRKGIKCGRMVRLRM